MTQELDRSLAVAPFYKLAGDEGSPDVVLIHGFGADRLSWLANASELGAHFSVWGVDLPGHGDAEPSHSGSLASLADTVLRGLKRNLSGKVHLVGHSLGGAVALELVRRMPDHVGSLSLIAPAGLGSKINREFVTALPLLEDAESAERLLHSLVARPRLINRHMVEHLLAHLRRPGRREALSAIAEQLLIIDATAADAVAHVRESAVPRMVIWGEEDAVIALNGAVGLATLGSERRMLAAAGHMPHVENPRAVNQWLIAFIASNA